MQIVNPVDKGRTIDWGLTSEDYAQFRPGPPNSLYEKLHTLGVGLRGQRILDLGTGTGVMARKFAAEGCQCSGIDISSNQIEVAQKLAKSAGQDINFQVSSADDLPFADNSFDCVTANQCWLYFDTRKTRQEVARVLKPDGLLMISHFSWLPLLDPVAKASEQLILKHNPQWSASDWHGIIDDACNWKEEGMIQRGMFFYDAEIPFTRESWRGRIRACRGVGAALEANAVQAFDQEHEKVLREITENEFTVLHRIDAHIFSYQGFDQKHVQ